MNSYEMWKLDLRELGNAEQDTHVCCIALTCTEKNEGRNNNVPRRGKAVKPHVFSFLISTGKPQSARHQNQTRYRHGETRLNHLHTNKENCWHDHARHVIDDEVEDMAVDMRGMETDVELAGDRTINTIENLADDQPQKCSPDMAVDDGLQRDEAGKSSASRQNMNTEPSPALGLRCLSIWHL